jgi:hypothetical protein
VPRPQGANSAVFLKPACSYIAVPMRSHIRHRTPTVKEGTLLTVSIGPNSQLDENPINAIKQVSSAAVRSSHSVASPG